MSYSGMMCKVNERRITYTYVHGKVSEQFVSKITLIMIYSFLKKLACVSTQARSEYLFLVGNDEGGTRFNRTIHFCFIENTKFYVFI